MTLPTKTIQQFVSDMTASWAASTGINQPAFQDGDVLFAWWNSVAVQLDFIQAQASLVVAMARAATSTGGDLDSFMAQFGVTRLPSTFATGQVTFSKNVASATQILVPNGSVVQTQGGTILYQTVADTSEPSYNAVLQGYLLQPGQTSMTGTVQALVGGSASNVQAGQLIQFGSTVAGIDAVTNPSPIVNGVDAELDTALRARFVLYLSTLAKGTENALMAAAESVQQGLLLNAEENLDNHGNPLLGSFTFFVDDGSGAPPTSLLNSVYNALNLTRAFSVQPFVVTPSALSATIAITVRIAAGFTPATVNVAVQNAIAKMVNALGPGVILYAGMVADTAANVPGVLSPRLSDLTINGSTSDLVPGANQEVRTSVAAITVGNY